MISKDEIAKLGCFYVVHEKVRKKTDNATKKLFAAVTKIVSQFDYNMLSTKTNVGRDKFDTWKTRNRFN